MPSLGGNLGPALCKNPVISCYFVSLYSFTLGSLSYTAKGDTNSSLLPGQELSRIETGFAVFQKL